MSTVMAQTGLSATGSATLTKPALESSVVFEVSGTYGSLQFVFEGSLNGTNFGPMAAVDLSTGQVVTGTLSPTDNSVAQWKLDAGVMGVVRARVTSIGSGTANFDARSDSLVGAPVLYANQTSSPVTSNLVLTTSSADALDVGQAGTTNPALKVDASTASSATGWKVKSAAATAKAALSVISSGTNEAGTIDAKGSGSLVLNGTATGLVSIGRGFVGTAVFSSTKTSIATQNSTPTAAQLLTGYISHASTTGAGTATLDTAANIDAAIPGVATGDSFQCVYSNTGTQTVTVTTATGLSLKGTLAVPSGKVATLDFFRTGSAAWDVTVVVSA